MHLDNRPLLSLVCLSTTLVAMPVIIILDLSRIVSSFSEFFEQCEINIKSFQEIFPSLKQEGTMMKNYLKEEKQQSLSIIPDLNISTTDIQIFRFSVCHDIFTGNSNIRK